MDPIVGCYQWFNNAPVVIRADGTVTGGPFTARWRLVNAERRAYTFTWPVMVETLTVSPDQRSMSGGNQYGYPISGGRVSGTVGLAGNWHWANGWNVSVAPNGTFTSGTWRGTWRAVDAARGIFEMNWPSPVDSVAFRRRHADFRVESVWSGDFGRENGSLRRELVFRRGAGGCVVPGSIDLADAIFQRVRLTLLGQLMRRCGIGGVDFAAWRVTRGLPSEVLPRPQDRRLPSR